MASERDKELDLSRLPLKERRRVAKLLAPIRNAQAQLEKIKLGDEDPLVAKFNVLLELAEELEAAKFYRKGSISRILARSMSASRSAYLRRHSIRFRVVAYLYLTQNTSLLMAQSIVADVEQVSLDAIKASCRKVRRGGRQLVFDRAANRFQTHTELDQLIKEFESELARRQGR